MALLLSLLKSPAATSRAEPVAAAASLNHRNKEVSYTRIRPTQIQVRMGMHALSECIYNGTETNEDILDATIIKEIMHIAFISIIV